MIKIVRTKKKHLNGLLVVGKTNWEYKWLNLEYLENTISKRGVHLTAFMDNKIVGSIMVVEEDYPKFWLYYFVVDKMHQRRGVGTALLKEAEARLPKGTLMFVDTSRLEKIGLKFYYKNGFKLMGKVKKWFVNTEGIILAKKI